MSIKASEISDLIKQRIDKFQSAAEARNTGTIVSVTDGICRIHGLADVDFWPERGWRRGVGRLCRDSGDSKRAGKSRKPQDADRHG